MSKRKSHDDGVNVESNVSNQGISRRALISALGLGGLAAAAPGVSSAGGWGKRRRRLSSDGFDVACDATSFRFSGPADANGLPAKGANFVVEGVIYESGTLIENDGLTAEGEPEYPEQVVGHWYCRGWFTQDMAAATTGVFVATTQIYDLGEEPGRSTMVSDGIELIDLDVPWDRAITGGTGPYRRARGQATQVAIGTNATGLFNFRFSMDLR